MRAVGCAVLSCATLRLGKHATTRLCREDLCYVHRRRLTALPPRDATGGDTLPRQAP